MRWITGLAYLMVCGSLLASDHFDTLCDDYACKKERYEQRKAKERYQTPEVVPVNPDESVCRTFSSTKMRRLNIEKRIAKGMTEAQVRASWGKPGQIDRLSDEQTQWFYQRFGERYYLTFLNGCLQRWR